MFQAFFVISSGQFSSEAEFPGHVVFEVNGATTKSETSWVMVNIFTRPLLASRVLLVLYHAVLTPELCSGLKLLFERAPHYVTLLAISPRAGSKAIHQILTLKFQHDVTCSFNEYVCNNKTPFLSAEQHQTFNFPVSANGYHEDDLLLSDNYEDDAILVEGEGPVSFYSNVGTALTSTTPPPKFGQQSTHSLDDVAWRLDLISATDAYGIAHQNPPMSFLHYKQFSAATRNVTTVKNNCHFNALEIRDLLSTSSWFPTLGRSFLSQLTEDASCSAYALHVDLYLTTSDVQPRATPHVPGAGGSRPAKRMFDLPPTQAASKMCKILRTPSEATRSSTSRNNGKCSNKTGVEGSPANTVQLQKPFRATKDSNDRVQPTVYANLPLQFRISAHKLHQLQNGFQLWTLRVVGVTQPTDSRYSPVPISHSVYRQSTYVLTRAGEKSIVAVVLITNPTQPPQVHLVLRPNQNEDSRIVATILEGFNGVNIRNGLFTVTRKTVHAGVYQAHPIATKSVDIGVVVQQVASQPGRYEFSYE